MTTTPSQSAAAPADERESFEKWVSVEEPGLTFERARSNTYRNSLIAWAWDAWQARAALSTAAPAGEPLREQRAVVGYMVHSSGPIETAALYPLSQHANALDAAHRWGASITSLVCAPGCPEAAAAAPAGESRPRSLDDSETRGVIRWLDDAIHEADAHDPAAGLLPDQPLIRALTWFRELLANTAGLEDLRTPAAPAGEPAPIDMVLHCPKCHLQHIDGIETHDEVDDRGGGQGALIEADVVHWENPPHRSHLCHGCGHIWRPADVPTNGVQAVQTKGKADSPISAAPAGEPPASQEPGA